MIRLGAVTDTGHPFFAGFRLGRFHVGHYKKLLHFSSTLATNELSSVQFGARGKSIIPCSPYAHIYAPSKAFETLLYIYPAVSHILRLVGLGARQKHHPLFPIRAYAFKGIWNPFISSRIPYYALLGSGRGKSIIPFSLYAHMPSKAFETLLYPAVSHVLRLVGLPGGEDHNT